MRPIDFNVLLASGYSVFLALLAAVLELVARHTHRRTERIRTVGFLYYPDLDVWKCPNGKHLYRAEVNRESTAVMYRAQPHHCNCCPIKNRCTDSSEGRTIEVQPNSWLASELRNFHRGLSLLLLLLADLILVLTAIRKNSIWDEILLVALLLSITGTGLRLLSSFIRHAEERA